MTVYKTYLKIVKKLLPVISVYTVIFFFFAVLIGNANATSNQTDFMGTKVPIAYFNHDQGPLGDQLKSYLNEKTKMIELDEDDTKIRDALFFRKVEYVITVPEHFSTEFLQGKQPVLTTLVLPDATSSYYITNLTNQFLNLANNYLLAGVTEDIGSFVLADLKQEIDIELATKEAKGDLTSVSYFFNFVSYVYLALFIIVVGTTMQAYHNVEIEKRNICSQYSSRKINRQLFFGHATIGLAIWLFFSIGSIFLYPNVMLTVSGLLFLLNSFLFATSVLSLAFLLSNLIKGTEALNSAANVVSLGMSFLCGAFVPQALLGSGVLLLASLFPSYWYIKANNMISESVFTNTAWQNLGLCFLFLIAFAIFYYMINHIVMRKRRNKESW